MSILHSIDPSLVDYYREHQLHDVYECLISGLITVCPEDPLEWIIYGIEKIEDEGIDNVSWDEFVPDYMKEKVKRVTETYLEDILFGLSTKPSDKMLADAYEFYRRKLMLKYFKALVQFCEYRIYRKMRDKIFTKKAIRHHKLKSLQVYFTEWKIWKIERLRKLNAGFDIIQSVYMHSLCRLLLKLWKEVSSVDRQKREYFETLQRGDLEDVHDVVKPTYNIDRISHVEENYLLLIFGYLDPIDLYRCEKVCRLWRVLIGSPVLWGNINFNRIKDKITDEFVRDCFFKYRAYIIHLNLRQCHAVQSRTLKSLMECGNLQDLNLSSCIHLNDDVMNRVLENCCGLLYLNISHSKVTDETMRLLSLFSVNLQYLSIAYCTKLTDKGLHSLAYARGCSKLIYLDVSGCTNFTSEGFLSLSQCCRDLKSFTANSFGSLNNDCLMHLSKCFNLRSVSLIGSCFVGDAGLKCLALNRKVQKLYLENNRNITDHTFKFFARHCWYLSHIHFIDCPTITDNAVRFIAHLRHLTIVNMTDCIRISDIGVRYLTDGLSGPKLKELHLTNCIKIGDITMIHISQRCLQLVYLSISYCERITDAGIDVTTNLPNLSSFIMSGINLTDKGLFVLGSLRCLKSVVVSECLAISDIGLDKFLFQVPRLDSIDISHCMELTDSALKSLAFYCRHLTSVIIAGCPNITNRGIKYLSTSCKYIRVLNVCGCIHLTDDSIKYLLKYCLQLKVVSLLYCKYITREAAKQISKRIERVEYNDEPVPRWFNYSNLFDD